MKLEIRERDGAKLTGICALLAALVWCVFAQTMRFEFINFDDMLVYQAPQVTRGLTIGGIGWAFTHAQGGSWIPLATITHMIDCQFYGLWAGGHHLTNVFLHTVMVILLFLVLRRMTGALWRSAFVAALFAIHPLRVESVAWVTERKDVLSGVFFMLTLWAYERYARRPVFGGNYAWVLVFFALGLMSKSMLVTMPAVLLLLDYWPLGRLENAAQFPALLKEKLPLLALSLLSCVATVLAARENIQPIAHDSLLPRIGNALFACVFYLRKLFYPSRLAALYPLLKGGPGAWQITGSCLLLAALTAGAFFLRRSHPYLLVGWLWFLGMLLPVIGIVQVGAQAYADRFTYLPQIGLGIACTWAAADWAGELLRRRALLGVAAAAVLLLLTVAAYRQAAYWRDSIVLWTHAFETAPDNDVARFSLGDALAEQGHTGEAIAEYREAVRMNPLFAKARNNLGIALYKEGQREEAFAEFREALRIDPTYEDAYCNLGSALMDRGEKEEGITEFRKAIQIDPDSAKTHYSFANALVRQGQTAEGIAQFREALRISPAYVEAHNSLGRALLGLGQTDEAIAELRESARIDPSFADAHNNLGIALFQQGRREEGIAEFRAALKIKPAYAEAHCNLGNALLAQGQPDEGIAELREAVRVDPTYERGHYSLAKALLGQGRIEAAIAELNDALKINPADGHAHNTLGIARFQQGRVEEAIAEFRQASKLNPADAEAHNNLAKALLDRGQTAEAIAEARKALELQPVNRTFQNNLAWMLATASPPSLRKGAEAVQLAMQASQAGGGSDPKILRTLAAAYAESGQYQEAIKTAQSALQLAENGELATPLRRDIQLYETGHALPDGQ